MYDDDKRIDDQALQVQTKTLSFHPLPFNDKMDEADSDCSPICMDVDFADIFGDDLDDPD